ncbi:MAG: T9SS type A sorting domain-containing protein, partial [Salinivirgaceae bacterium]|nr:T9SS type A sorting domain-containing protein [Salinivirgaceae bacterium]
EPQPQEPDTTTVGIIGSTTIGLTAYTANHAIVIENATSAVSVFDIAGRLIATANPAQRIVINVPKNGIYIVGTRHDSLKVMVK